LATTTTSARGRLPVTGGALPCGPAGTLVGDDGKVAAGLALATAAEPCGAAPLPAHAQSSDQTRTRAAQRHPLTADMFVLPPGPTERAVPEITVRKASLPLLARREEWEAYAARGMCRTTT